MNRILFLTPDHMYVKGFSSALLNYLKSNNASVLFTTPIYINAENISLLYPSFSGKRIPLNMYSLGTTVCLVIDLPKNRDIRQMKGASTNPLVGTIRHLSSSINKSFSAVHSFDHEEEDAQFVNKLFNLNLADFNDFSLLKHHLFIKAIKPISQFELDSRGIGEVGSKLREIKSYFADCLKVSEHLGHMKLSHKLRMQLDSVNLLLHSDEGYYLNGLKNLKFNGVYLTELEAHILSLEKFT